MSTRRAAQATKNPFYLHVGRELVESLNQHSRARCGYATLHSVIDKTQEDRMESFFLSETCKYLYLVSACARCVLVCCVCGLATIDGLGAGAIYRGVE